MHDLSLYVLEMIENSLRAGAGTVAVRVWVEPPRDELTIVVEDDGPGLDVSVEQATDPFYTTKAGKRTGLGLPLFREAAEAAGGPPYAAPLARAGRRRDRRRHGALQCRPPAAGRLRADRCRHGGHQP